MTSLRFTKTSILALLAPEAGKRLTIYDAEVPKLALRVTHTGTRTFYVVKRAGTSMAWVKLGVFPDMTVEQARIEAQKVLGEFATGVNVAKVKRAIKEELTFSQLFAEYGERHGQQKKSWRDDQQRFRDYLEKPLGKAKLSEITRADVARILSNAEKAGKAVATVRAIRALTSIIFAKGIEWGYLETNPAQGVKISGKKVTRDRFLQSDELPRFFVALAEEPSAAIRDLILLALLTGARRANLCAMHWNEINLADGVWRIPATKKGDPQNVTLCPEAVTILEARMESTKGGFVFPSANAVGHILEPRQGIERVMKRAGIPFGRKVPNGVTFHDLRRTLGSWQARAGASLAIIGKSLNHKSQQATAIYARLDLDPVRASVNAATSAMLVAGAVKDGGDVIPMKKRSA